MTRRRSGGLLGILSSAWAGSHALEECPAGCRAQPTGRRRSPVLCAGLSLALTAVAHAAQPAKPANSEEILPERVEVFKVRTRSELNKEIPYYLRVPKNYRPGKPYRLLFLCPVVNQGGLIKFTRSAAWLALADERDWFVLTCTFTQSLKDVQNRKLSYYYPETFSGRATLEALALVSKKYPAVDTERLLMQGQSGGAQFVHRFAIWASDRVTAVAVNSSSWFDAPNAHSNRVAWLITIGESDDSYNNSLEMVERLRNVGAAPLFRSYMGMVHEDSRVVDTLDLEFLKFYDDLTKKHLGQKHSALTPVDERLAMPADKMPWVGDCQDWKFVRNTPQARDAISEDSRIYLPSEGLATLWGKAEDKE